MDLRKEKCMGVPAARKRSIGAGCGKIIIEPDIPWRQSLRDPYSTVSSTHLKLI
jgi:hypothetical protein